MNNFAKLEHLIKLKGVTRQGEVKDRRESTAEHTWACMILAEHFLKIIKQPLDEVKVMKLIMFHDLVEIECGDIDVLDEEGRKNKKSDEKEGSRRLAKSIPETLSEDYLKFFDEYEESETMEAKFALAMDKLEPMVHWSLYHPGKLILHGWNEQLVIDKKLPAFKPFPELVIFLEEWLEYMKEKNYL